MKETAAPDSKSKGILVIGLMIAMLFAALDNTIVGTAMPKIIGQLGGLSLITWVTTAYMLTSTTIVPIAGKLPDLFGRKLIYVTGIVIFIAGSALCGVAQTMEQLIIFRGIQGIGGGVMMPMAMIIIGDIFTGKERAKWQGVFGGIFGLSSVIGPQIGGWIVDHWNWHWVFYINLPVGFLALAFIMGGLPKHRSQGAVKIDFAGIITMIVGVVSLLLALSLGGKNYAWGSWQIIGMLVLAIASLAAFVRIEARTSEAILPMYLFKKRMFTTVNGIGFFMSLGMFGAVVFVPLFMQGIVGISATASGTVMMPMMVALIAASVIGGQFVYKLGARRQMIIGMLIAAVSFYMLSTMDGGTTRTFASIYMVVLGLGIGLVMPLLTLVLQENFNKEELGVVTSSSQFFRSIGGTFGITILGAIMNHSSSHELDDKLTPIVNAMPADAADFKTKMTGLIHTDPQALYNSLLDANALKQMPKEAVDSMLPVLKSTLVDSLHGVFLYGLVFIIVGALLAALIGNVKLKQRSKNAKDEANPTALSH
ncbi:MDR family MFS transporter [Paenibacillus sp. R14(2021)]|uniref:MDR family MFS transporter n=1 Tax=Paenibacillus sp. R14(2021) TaxID=2859228 RepID=UPI001C614858|nr:MDR family MFS transporter [Paenibacillus sp. R14(2021)]